MPGSTISDLQVRVGADISGAESGLSKVNKDIRDTGNAAEEANPKAAGFLQRATGGVLELAKAVPGLGQMASGIADLATGLVSGNAQFETFETQFSVMLKGSDDMSKGMERAKQRIGELSTFAATTPFELPQVVNAGKVLQAFGLQGEQSMKRFGLSTTDVLKVVGDAAAGSGADFGELSNTFGKLASGATGDALSRLQELGIVTKQQLADEGVMFDKSGAVMSSTDDLFKTVVSHIKGHMGGMMEAQSATFEGMLSNLSDWKDTAIRQLSAPIFEVLKTNLNGFLTFLGSDDVKNAMSAFASMVASGIGTTMQVVGGIVSTVGPPLMAFFQTVVTNGLSLLTSAWNQAKPFFDGFIAFLQSNIAEGGGIDITNFLKGLPAPLQAVGQWLGDVAVNFSVFFDAIGNGENIIQSLVDLIQNNMVALFSNLGATFSQIMPLVGAFQQISDALQTFWNTITSGGDIMTAFGTMIGSVAPALATMGGSIIDILVSTVLPQLVQWAGQAASALISWIGPMIPPLLANLGQWGTAILDWLGANLPGWIAKLAEWGMALINWVLPMIPPLLGFLAQLLGDVLGWLLGTALPALIDNLGKWGQAFVDWVGPQIPPLLAQLGVLAGQMWDWLTGTALPTLMQKLGEWGSAFITWVGPRIGPLLGELASLLGSLVGWLIGTALPAIILKLGEWALAFVSWVVPQIPKLIGFLGQLLGSLGNWLISTALPAIVSKLGEWGAAFLNWIGTTVLPFIGQKLGEFGNAILNWIGGMAGTLLNKAGEMGHNIISGLTGALSAGRDQVINFIIGIAQGALDAIKNFFGIHSPSDEMHDVGSYLIQGFNEGMVATGDQTVNTIMAFGQRVKDAWNLFFGPFTQDGTLVNMLFRGDDQGFFWNLGRGTDLALTTVTFQWVGLMAHLKDEVNAALGEMAIGVRSEAATVADNMIQGFLDALNAGAGAVQGAIASTFAGPAGGGGSSAGDTGTGGGSGAGGGTGGSGGGSGGASMLAAMRAPGGSMAGGGGGQLANPVGTGSLGGNGGGAGGTVITINGMQVTAPPDVAAWLVETAQRKNIHNRGVTISGT